MTFVQRAMAVRLNLTLICSVAFCAGAAAQSTPTASRTLGLEGYAGFALVVPDYDATTDKGFFLGGNITRPYRNFEPALDIRYTRATGPEVGESSFTGALKVGKGFGPQRRFHPYGQVGAGYGTITYDHPIIFAQGPYTHDNSFIYTFGAGLEYDLPRHLGVKADYTYQHWNLGDEIHPLTPTAVSIGVTYRLSPGRLSIR